MTVIFEADEKPVPVATERGHIRGGAGRVNAAALSAK